MTLSPERERVIELIGRLPERDQALYWLGAALHLTLIEADERRTEADLAYAREVASRIVSGLNPDGALLEMFEDWLKPGGALRWSKR